MKINEKRPIFKRYFLFYQEEIRPEIIKVMTQKTEGYHGLDTHTYNVIFRGIDYAIALNKNPLPVLFACAFHDIARINDGDEINHGKRAIPLLKPILKKFSYLLTKEEQKSIIQSVALHTIGRHPSDYISACLWDADRTRLAWECGYEEKYFTTEYAKKIASLRNPSLYLKYQSICMGETTRGYYLPSKTMALSKISDQLKISELKLSRRTEKNNYQNQ